MNKMASEARHVFRTAWNFITATLIRNVVTSILEEKYQKKIMFILTDQLNWSDSL